MDDAPTTILMVDDRDANLLALEAVLEPLGIERERSSQCGIRSLLAGGVVVGRPPGDGHER